MGNDGCLLRLLDSEGAFAKGHVLAEDVLEIVLGVVDTEFAKQHKHHLVGLISDLGHDFSPFVNSLL